MGKTTGIRRGNALHLALLAGTCLASAGALAGEQTIITTPEKTQIYRWRGDGFPGYALTDRAIVGIDVETGTNALSRPGPGILLKPAPAHGRNGGNSSSVFKATGGRGGDGGAAAGISILYSGGGISTSGNDASGIVGSGIGGNGGDGGRGGAIRGIGGNGGYGATGAAVTIEARGQISTEGANSHGILAESIGGNGGAGGTGAGVRGEGGRGGNAAGGGAVSVDSSAAISTKGRNATGIYAQSVGGQGGGGGSGKGISGQGWPGGTAAPGGTVTIGNRGRIDTWGEAAHGIFAQSVGGFGGAGGSGGGLVGYGASGSSAGAGGSVSVTNEAGIATRDDDARAIFAQSVGGGGGAGGSGKGLVGLGAGGSVGGAGGDISVVTRGSGLLSTDGKRAQGIFAQSVGGGGGEGGDSGGLVSLGGSGSETSAGGKVTIASTQDIATSGEYSAAIYAQSVGGGGGNSGSSSGLVAIGGSGGSGGDGGAVDVTAGGRLSTQGVKSEGVLAQSIGGGGGNANRVVSGGVVASVAIGGSGGKGGKGGRVKVSTEGGGSVATAGTSSVGVMAQSVGGGGGNGSVTFANNAVAGAAVSLGGRAGSGGTGGEVTLENAASVSTSGFQSSAVLAQSVGGGGGNGGIAASASAGVISASVALGGSGGDAGGGSNIHLTNSGEIRTLSDLSFGVEAQSIGGGGGNGGMSIAATLAVGTGASAGGSVSLGGKAGGGGSGGAVTLANGGAVSTGARASDGAPAKGAGSHALLAQSIGGGGGAGGLAGAATVQFGNGGALALALGGAGGSGGDGGAVTVTNNAALTTWGDGASGIVAQSIGGGGGDGGGSFSGTLSAGANNGRIAVALGGSGGSGGAGQTVSVRNDGAVATDGDRSAGILAQSIGGGGGTGGFSVSGTVGYSANGGSVGVTVGGSGGSGGKAGDVSVTGSGAIATKGREANAVHAQSIGGGGGTGGLSIVGSLSVTGANGGQAGVSVGGSGGSGGSGGKVDVALTDASKGAVTTEGYASHGVKAQSIGGGGGDGGLSIEAGIGFSGTGTTANIGVSVGGKGGAGGSGGAVTVANQKTVRVKGVNSTGIFAQSVGGGGGDGGGAITAVVSRSDTKTEGARTVNVAVAIGGGGGRGNNGGAVSVVNSGAIETGDIVTADGRTANTGGGGHAIFAQSIGGGGGVGGRANAINLVIGAPACPDGAKKVAAAYCPDEGENQKANKDASMTLSASVGGNGGGASDGGNVRIGNAGNLVTRGTAANGIHAQSIGGGGGDGGNGSLGAAELFSGTAGSILTKVEGQASLVSGAGKNYSVTVGGNAGSSGNGSAVTVANSGNITTYGDSSDGIFAQSVGGGGGVSARAGNATGGATFGVGGKGGSGGNGGTVDVNVKDRALIETFGKAATGIFAQSVGGGGGLGGDVLKSSDDETKTGVGIALGGGSGGDGGAVSVGLNGSVVTHGDETTAIFAQSVGGGGGVSGRTSISEKGLQPAFIGSNGDRGAGKDVSVYVNGSVLAAGSDSTGIFAQSMGGTGQGGNVSLSVYGSVAAPGGKGTAIRAESNGRSGGGNISLQVDKYSTVIAGKGGVAVDFVGGNKNALDNSGTISAIGGIAIRQSGRLSWDGDRLGTTVNNFGTISGGIRFGNDGQHEFVNRDIALLNTGSELTMGKGTFLNLGTINPGGINAVETTVVSVPAFTQAGKMALYEVDLDVGKATADKLVFTGQGSVTLGGAIKVNPINLGKIYQGGGAVEIATSDAGNILYDDLRDPMDTATISYTTKKDRRVLALGYYVDFAPVGLSAPSMMVGSVLASRDDASSESAIPDAMKPVVDALVSIEGLEGYDAALRQISPQAFDAFDMLSVSSSLQFSGDMMSCKVADAPSRFTAEGQCAWALFDTRHVMRDGGADTTGYDETGSRLSVGAQGELTDNSQLGFGLSWDRYFTTMGAHANAEGHRIQVGGVFKAQYGQTSFAATVTGGVSLSDVDRIVALPGAPVYALQSDQTLAFVTGQAQIAHTFEMGDWYVRPSMSAALSEVRRFSFTESGAGPVALDMGGGGQTFYTLNPAVELGGEIKLDDALLRPFLRAGVVKTDTVNAREVSAAITGLPGVSLPWKIDAASDPVFADVAAGITVLLENRAALRLSGHAAFGDGYRSYSGNLKLSVPF